MSRRSDSPAAPFTAPERDLLRRELCRHFGEDPRVADGIFLRTWRSGERRNQPKIPPAVQTMLERGLVELRTTSRGPRAFFTEAGLAGKSETEIVDGFCRRAVTAGLPVTRALVIIDTLHPVHEGHVFRWRSDGDPTDRFSGRRGHRGQSRQ